MSLLGEMKVSAEQMRLLIMTDAFSNETGVRQYRQVFFFTTTVSEGNSFLLQRVTGVG